MAPPFQQVRPFRSRLVHLLLALVHILLALLVWPTDQLDVSITLGVPASIGTLMLLENHVAHAEASANKVMANALMLQLQQKAMAQKTAGPLVLVQVQGAIKIAKRTQNLVAWMQVLTN